MSVLVDYINKKAEFERLKEDLELLESSPELKKEMEFKDALVKLAEDFEKSPQDLLHTLVQIDPTVANTPSDRAQSKKRPMMVYRNPHTGEVVKTRGGNHKTLNEWRTQHGRDVVDQWKQEAEK